MGIILLIIPAIGLLLAAIICLVKGYKAVTNNEKDSQAYLSGKNTLRTGIIISIIIFVVLLIGGSLCLGMLGM